MEISASLNGKRPTWAEIDLNALDSNFMSMRRMLSVSVRILAVIKANAYGHGAVAVARRLEQLGADYLAVAILEEALELRSAGINLPILLLNGFWQGQEKEVIEANLTTAVWNRAMIRSLDEAACQLKRKVRCHLKVDTGMSRLGCSPKEAVQFLVDSRTFEWIEYEGIFTHLSSSENQQSPATRQQLEQFRQIHLHLSAHGLSMPWNHVANSGAILGWPESWYDAVRPGLLLYGLGPIETPRITLKPLLSLKTRILQLKRIKKGVSVGYGETYTVPRDSVLGILPVGYADGFSRRFSNRGSVLLHGQRVPIAGRISMDLTAIDVTETADAQVGDEVVLLGRQGGEEITAGELAGLMQTIPYEVLTAIGQRVPRIYV